MKITKLEAIPCSIPRQGGGPGSNVVLIKVYTDEGIIGAGEGGQCNQDAVMLTAKTIGGMIIGENPFDIGLIMNKLSMGFGGSNATFNSSIDFALYDIMGKAMNQPVYQLLGGKALEKLAIGMEIARGTPKERAAVAERALNNGVRNMVCKTWGANTIFDVIENVKAIREVVGDEVLVGIDANGGLDYSTALDLCLRLEEYDIYKVEQPVPSWDIDGLARLQKKLHTPVWAHESAISITGLLECIKKDACDGVCIKLAWSGGIRKSLEWTGIAKAANLAISCGSMMGSGYEAAAQAHFLAADPWMSKYAHANLGPALLSGQWDTTNPPVTTDLSKNPPVYKDGYFYPPEGPGLGLELNEELIPRIITQGKSPIVVDQRVEFPFF